MDSTANVIVEPVTTGNSPSEMLREQARLLRDSAAHQFDEARKAEDGAHKSRLRGAAEVAEAEAFEAAADRLDAMPDKPVVEAAKAPVAKGIGLMQQGRKFVVGSSV